MEKSKTCACSGHRPSTFSWGENENDERCLILKEQLREQIINAIDKGYDTFISGMAMGTDTYFAEIVLELKKIYPDIKLICAIPFTLQYSNWKNDDKQRYFKILWQCEYKKVISEKYTKTCYADRNKFMVDNSSLLIAIYKKGTEKGGTKQTINYAQKSGIDIVIIDV